MILKNANIHTMESKDYDKGYIKIENGLITEIGSMEDYKSGSDKEVDLSGLDVYPGFIDAHSHIGLMEDSLGFEGEDINESTDPVTPQLRVIDGINPMDECFKEALEGGVTAVAVSPGSANPIAGQISVFRTYGKRIDKMVIKSPIAIKFALGENPKNTYKDSEQSPITRMATAGIIYETLNKAKRYYEDKQRHKENKDEYDKPEYDAKLEALVPLIRGEIKAHFHAHRADDIFTALRISKEFNIEPVIVHATQGHLIADELKNENVDIFSGPFLSERSKPELKGLTPESPGIMSKEGIKLSIVTDHSVIPEQYLTLCAALAVREGMDEEEALKAITLYPSLSLGVYDKIGSLKEGKYADIVVYNGTPLDFKNKPIMVMVEGNVVYDRLKEKK